MVRTLVALAIALSLLSPVSAAGKPVDGVAAVVDGRVITRSEVEELVMSRRLMAGDAPKVADARKEALEALIEQNLVQKEADRLGIAVTDEEVKKTITDIRIRNGMDEDTFRKALAAQGMEYSRYEQEMRVQIRRVKVASQVLRSRMAVGDDALREFYLKHVADFCEPEQVRLTHVELSKDRSEAEELRAKIATGEETEARRKAKDMGFLSPDSLSEVVRKAVRGLRSGGVSPVVEIEGSCHLFIVQEEKRGRVPAYEEVADEVRARYFEDKEEELYRTWMDSLKERARIDRKM